MMASLEVGNGDGTIASKCPTLEVLPSGWKIMDIRKINGKMAKYYIAPSGKRHRRLESALRQAKGDAESKLVDAKEDFPEGEMKEKDESDKFVDVKEESEEKREVTKQTEVDGINPPRDAKKLCRDHTSAPPINQPKGIQIKRKQAEMPLLHQIMKARFSHYNGDKRKFRFLMGQQKTKKKRE